MLKWLPILVFSSSLLAVDPRATYVSKHRIGEGFQEWLAINQLDLTDICGPHKRSDKRMDFKAVCNTLSSIRDTGHGQFYLGDEATKQAFQWVFFDAKLALVSAEYPGPETAQQIGFLVDSYGPATLSRTVKYQNGYGAALDCRENAWTMPDGTSITAIEVIRPTRFPTRWLIVKFSSKEYTESLSRERESKPNPYAR